MPGSLIIGLNETTLNFVERKLLSSPCIAGVIFFARNYQNKNQLSQLVSTIQDIRKRHHLPKAIIFLDHEGGSVQRLRNDSFTTLPAANKIGGLFQQNPKEALQLVKSIAQVTAIELGSIGIDVVLGPVLDLPSTKKRNKNLSRFYTPDPMTIGKITECYIHELQQYGLNAAPKHFPGSGGNTIDTHSRVGLSNSNLKNLLFRDLVPYQYLIAHTELKALMLSHSVYWKIDSLPVNSSSTWIKKILRQQLGFQGIIITDCIQMIGAKNNHIPLIDKIMVSLNAGCDLILCSHPYRGTYKEIYEAIRHPAMIEHNNSSSKVNSLINQNPPDFYINLMTSTIYLNAKKIIVDFNERSKMSIKQKTRTSIPFFWIQWEKYQYQIKLFFIQNKNKKRLSQLLMYFFLLDYHFRLNWLKFKNFCNRLIRHER